MIEPDKVDNVIEVPLDEVQNDVDDDMDENIVDRVA